MRRFKNAVLTRRIAMLLVVLMGVLSVAPRIEASFVPSGDSFASSARQNDLATVQKFLEQKLIKERLKALGYTDEEINTRLDQLSDGELHQFATQLDSLASGGSTIMWILVIALVVVAVLYFTNKRIVIQ
jgi:hypothetical protein